MGKAAQRGISPELRSALRELRDELRSDNTAIEGRESSLHAESEGIARLMGTTAPPKLALYRDFDSYSPLQGGGDTLYVGEGAAALLDARGRRALFAQELSHFKYVDARPVKRQMKWIPRIYNGIGAATFVIANYFGGDLVHVQTTVLSSVIAEGVIASMSIGLRKAAQDALMPIVTLTLRQHNDQADREAVKAVGVVETARSILKLERNGAQILSNVISETIEGEAIDAQDTRYAKAMGFTELARSARDRISRFRFETRPGPQERVNRIIDYAAQYRFDS